jgi:hypothetical protein
MKAEDERLRQLVPDELREASIRTKMKTLEAELRQISRLTSGALRKRFRSSPVR